MHANCCSAKMRDHGANDRDILSTRTRLVRRRTSAGHRRTTYCDRLNSTMDKVSFLDELQDRLAALMRNTPAADLQKNVKALLTQQFARLELVTREEFDTQTKVLAKTRAKLEGLERRLTEIENRTAR
jgi:BMFP domain-containing protein YqiC